MGRYYALHDGEDAAVAEAIGEHYSPLGPNDRCPTAPVSVALALADKLDTLVGFFGIHEWPTGSKDPYALRRSALGVIRIILENGLNIPLLEIFGAAARLYNEQGIVKLGARGPVGRPLTGLARDTAETLLAFFADRLKVHLRERGLRHDLVSAVFALGGEDDLERLIARADVLADFLQGQDGPNLLTAYKRASNIVRIEEKKDGKSYSDRPLDWRTDERLRTAQDEERELRNALTAAYDKIGELLQQKQFAEAMAMLARLRKPVDDFFDKVTVNVPDPAVRLNRLYLLAGINAVMNRVADFSKIEG
jgi:glycyl-tRNA synthetase beta chain